MNLSLYVTIRPLNKITFCLISYQLFKTKKKVQEKKFCCYLWKKSNFETNIFKHSDQEFEKDKDLFDLNNATLILDFELY